MQRLNKHLKMHMCGAALLELDGTIHCINSAKNAATGCGVAAESICARIFRHHAVWAIWTESYSEEVSKSKPDNRVKPINGCKRVPGKHCLSRVVVRQQSKKFLIPQGEAASLVLSGEYALGCAFHVLLVWMLLAGRVPVRRARRSLCRVQALIAAEGVARLLTGLPGHRVWHA